MLDVFRDPEEVELERLEKEGDEDGLRELHAKRAKRGREEVEAKEAARRERERDDAEHSNSDMVDEAQLIVRRHKVISAVVCLVVCGGILGGLGIFAFYVVLQISAWEDPTVAYGEVTHKYFYCRPRIPSLQLKCVLKMNVPVVVSNPNPRGFYIGKTKLDLLYHPTEQRIGSVEFDDSVEVEGAEARGAPTVTKVPFVAVVDKVDPSEFLAMLREANSTQRVTLFVSGEVRVFAVLGLYRTSQEFSTIVKLPTPDFAITDVPEIPSFEDLQLLIEENT